LQAMLVNLDGEDDVPALQSGSHSPPRTGNADVDDNSRRCVLLTTSCSYTHVYTLNEAKIFCFWVKGNVFH